MLLMRETLTSATLGSIDAGELIVLHACVNARLDSHVISSRSTNENIGFNFEQQFSCMRSGPAKISINAHACTQFVDDESPRIAHEVPNRCVLKTLILEQSACKLYYSCVEQIRRETFNTQEIFQQFSVFHLFPDKPRHSNTKTFGVN